MHPGDVGDPEFCQELVAGLVADRGRVDYLVNNAGLLIESSVSRMQQDQWDDALRVNLSAPFYLAQAVIAPMTAQGFGRIVNIGSVTAAMGNPVEAGYGAAKAGLLGLTRSLARAVARKGITVNLVVPGVFETEMTRVDAARGARGDPRDDPARPPRRPARTGLGGAVPARRGGQLHHRLGGNRGRRPVHGRLNALDGANGPRRGFVCSFGGYSTRNCRQIGLGRA